MSGAISENLPLETSQFTGAIVAAIAYGLHIAVFLHCMYYILPQARRRRTRVNVCILVYVAATFSFGTVTLACYARSAQLMFVDHRTYPGGPSAWLSLHTGDAVSILGTISFSFCVLLANGILLWRTYILWGPRSLVLILPILLYLASIAFAIPTILQLARPRMDLWAHTTVSLNLVYLSLVISLTTLLHLLLEHATAYISIYTMIIESAVPYTVTSLVFIACYARKSNAQNIILPVLGQVTCINPELLILRVARGRAVDAMKSPPVASSIRFRRPTSNTVDTVSHPTATHQRQSDTPTTEDPVIDMA